MRNEQERSRKSAATNHPYMEIKTAVTGLLDDVAGVKGDVIQRLKTQENRLDMMEKKQLASARPALGGCDNMTSPHKKAFAAYLRTGEDDAIRSLGVEGKAMSTAVAADGGFLVDPQTSEKISTVLHSAASIRSISSVVTVESTAFDVLVDHADIGAGWATETDPSAETTTPQLDRISIPLHELSAMPKASQRLLDDSAFDVESWLAARVADKFARAEASPLFQGMVSTSQPDF